MNFNTIKINTRQNMPEKRWTRPSMTHLINPPTKKKNGGSSGQCVPRETAQAGLECLKREKLTLKTPRSLYDALKELPQAP